MTFKEFLQLLEAQKDDKPKSQGGSLRKQIAMGRGQGIRLNPKVWGAKDTTRRQERKQSKSDLKKFY